MGASASVIQEYYKAVDYWADIAGNRDWKLSVWIVGQNDVDLVDRFLEIERSPVGRFDDIFFRFDTPYKGDDEEYAEQLWQEYAGWFSEKVEEKYDILRALRHDGLLREEYTPDVSVEHTAGNLWREMLRFKACISRLDDAFFCLYFPPEQERGCSRTGWFGNVLKEGVPQGIRMTTIDLRGNRNVRLDESREVVCIRPRFDMAAALHNRMARSDSGNDLIAPENRFKQQVTVVMDCTQKQDWKLLDREIRKLLDISKEMKDTNIRTSALFIASEACYAAHHIVAGDDPRAQDARDILELYKIDINCAENGIYLKHIDPNSKQSGAYHRIIHTDQYYKTVNQRILDASNFGGRTGVLNELQRLQEDLLFNKQIW